MVSQINTTTKEKYMKQQCYKNDICVLTKPVV